MTPRIEKLLYFLLLSASFSVLLNIFDKISFILIPFIVALIFSALLNPATSLMAKKIPRPIAAAVCALFVVLILVFVLFSTVPFLYKETMGIVSGMAEKSMIDNLIFKINEFGHYFNIDNLISQKTIVNYLKDDMSILKTVGTNVFQGAQSLTTFIFLIVICPFMVFMILKDLPYLSNALIGSAPLKYKEIISSTIKDLNDLVFRYFGGQFLVSIFLFSFYMFFFSIFKVHNKLYISLIVAISNFFPYVGFYLAAIISLFLNIKGVQYVHMYDIVVLFSILGIGQIIEGNLVTPKIVGDRVGLKPIFIILGTMISIPIFGLVGLVLGTPVTIVVSYLFRRFVLETRNVYN